MIRKISPLPFFIALLIFAGCAGAKHNKEKTTEPAAGHEKEKYAVLSWGGGSLVYKKTQGTINTAFPFTVKNAASGAVTTGTFTGSLKGLFSSNIFLMDLLNIEAGKKNNFIIGGIGFNSNLGDIWSVYLKAGAGHSFPVHFGGKTGSSGLLFKPSLSVQYMAGANERLGSIDNKGKDLLLLGQTAGHQFVVPGDPDNNTPDETYDAGTLGVSIISSRVMLVPKLSLGSGMRRWFYWSADLAWMIQAFESTRLFLTQYADDENRDSKSVASIRLNAHGAATNFNNTPVVKSPSISGMYLGLNLGFYLYRR